MFEPTRQLFTCNVAGFSHWYGAEVFSQLEPGTQLKLKSQPDNPFDPYAVEVYYKDVKLGYVPKACNGEISILMYFGHADVLEARVLAIYKEKHPEQQVSMGIYVTDARHNHADDTTAGSID
ncbi:MAG: HIRAN domain-containing protein [Atopobiaceae bacterium]|jgi:hypothetical protein